MALKLSANEGNDSQVCLDEGEKFSGFEDDGSNDEDIESFSESDVKAESIPESKDILKSVVMCTNKQELGANSSSELPIKRQMKKVNFTEDDDSEDWTGCQSSGSDTDEDFCPSKQKKLPQKEINKKLTSKSKKPIVNDKLIKCEKLAPNKDDISLASANKSKKPCLTMPLNSVTSICVDPTEACESPKLISCTKLVTPKNIPNAISKSSPKLPIISKASLSSSSSIIESGNSKNSFSLVKTPFKSPSLGSMDSNEFQKTSTAKTGLRLGLSRSRNVKPLHPNVCIR